VKVTDEGRALIQHHEGLRLKAYRCPRGRLTIGWGHTGDVKEGDVITEHQADVIFEHDLETFEDGVSYLCQHIALSDNQFAALVSLAFNVGINAFSKSTLLRKLLRGDVAGAEEEWPRWNHVNHVVDVGVTARRADELALFMRLH
jgi:lysozyme